MAKTPPKLEQHKTPSGLHYWTYGRTVKAKPGELGPYDRVASFVANEATLEHEPTKDGLAFAIGVVNVAELTSFPNHSRQLRRRRAQRGWIMEVLDAKTYEEVGEICLEYWYSLHTS